MGKVQWIADKVNEYENILKIFGDEGKIQIPLQIKRSDLVQFPIELLNDQM